MECTGRHPLLPLEATRIDDDPNDDDYDDNDSDDDNNDGDDDDGDDDNDDKDDDDDNEGDNGDENDDASRPHRFYVKFSRYLRSQVRPAKNSSTNAFFLPAIRDPKIEVIEIQYPSGK